MVARSATLARLTRGAAPWCATDGEAGGAYDVAVVGAERVRFGRGGGGRSYAARVAAQVCGGDDARDRAVLWCATARRAARGRG